MSSYKQKVIRGFIAGFAMTLTIAGLGYVTRIILAKNLSLKEYGLFYAVFAFVSFFNIFRDLGIGATSIMLISKYNAKGDKKGIKTTVVSGFFFQATIISAIFLGMILSTNYLSLNFFKADAFLVMLFIGLSYLISVSQDITSTISAGFQSMLYANLSELLRHAGIIILLLLGLLFYPDSLTAAYAAFSYFVIMFFLFPLHLMILNRFVPGFFNVKSGDKVKKIKDMLKFAFPVLISSMGGMIIAYSDTIMLTYFKTLEDVALYNVAIPISMILWYFGASIAAIMLPIMSEMWNKNEKDYVREGISLLHRYSFAFIIPFALIFVAYPEIIIRILFGEKYVGAALALRILSVGAIMYNIAIINSNIIVGIGKPAINSRIMIAAAIFNIIFNILLIPRFGIVGAASSTAASYALVFVFNTINLKNITKAKLPLLQYLKISLGGVIFLAIVSLLKGYLEMNAYLEAIVVSIISFAFYGAYLFLARIISVDETKDVFLRVMKR